MKTKLIIALITVVSLVMLWLNGRQIVNNISYLEQPVLQTLKDTLKEHPGKVLLKTKCYACHNPTADHDNRLAPPMVAVKYHYKNDNTTLEQFTDELWNFVKEPSQDKIKMRGAVRRFGVMPFQEFKQEEIGLIADYLYNNNIKQPSWFKDHLKSMQKGRE